MKYIFLLVLLTFLTNTLAQSENLGNEVKLNMNNKLESNFDKKFAEDLRRSMKKYIEKAKIKSKGKTNSNYEIESKGLIIGDIEHMSPYSNNVDSSLKIKP